MKPHFLILLILALSACSVPLTLPGGQPLEPPGLVTVTAPVPSPTPTEAMCAFVEGRQQLPDISQQLVEKLRSASLPVKTARAEAYGENCITDDGTLVRFAARETDYYLSFTVTDLDDRAALGALLEKSLALISLFPVASTPGPNPGYIGVKFEHDESVLNLWFLRSRADELLAQGMTGERLYEALKQPQ